MKNTPGTADQAAGLSGLPFALVLMAMIVLAVAAIWCLVKKRRATGVLLLGGATMLLYLLWNVWPVFTIALLTLAVGLVARLSIFARLRRAGSAALKAVREEPVDGDTPPTSSDATE